MPHQHRQGTQTQNTKYAGQHDLRQVKDRQSTTTILSPFAKAWVQYTRRIKCHCRCSRDPRALSPSCLSPRAPAPATASDRYNFEKCGCEPASTPPPALLLLLRFGFPTAARMAVFRSPAWSAAPLHVAAYSNPSSTLWSLA